MNLEARVMYLVNGGRVRSGTLRTERAQRETVLIGRDGTALGPGDVEAILEPPEPRPEPEQEMLDGARRAGFTLEPA